MVPPLSTAAAAGLVASATRLRRMAAKARRVARHTDDLDAADMLNECATMMEVSSDLAATLAELLRPPDVQ